MILTLVTFGLMLAVGVAAYSGPRFTTIDFPGAVTTVANGINPAGDIVGAFVDSSGEEHGFLIRAGSFTSFDYPGSVWTEAWGINPQGDIVGQYGLSDNTVHGFLLRDGNLYPVDVPGQPNTMPVGISPNGTIVGCYHVGTPSGGTILNTMFGFVMDSEGVTSYPMARTMHNGIDPSGDITGNHADPTTGRFINSYVIHDGVTSWFTFPGSRITRAWDISATGDVVGFYQDSSLHFHGFLLRHDELTSIDVDLPGVTATRAFGINAEGDIVGFYSDATGVHGFLRSRRGRE
jgi:uncharacterized membrane protein